MKASQPPRLGRLMLERLGPRNDSIVGDLSEEWHAGRSALWYWRQVLVAIAFQIVEDARYHWVVVVRGILTGLLLLYAFGWILASITAPLTRWILPYPSGVILMRYYELGFLIHIASLSCGAMLAGWIIARLHDRQRAAAILGLVLTLGVFAVSNERFYFLIRNSLGHERFIPYLMRYLFQAGAVMTGVFIGGLVRPLTASLRESPSAVIPPS